MLGIFCLEPLLDRFMLPAPESRTPFDQFHRQLCFVGVASFLAILVNPYGPGLLTNVLRLASDTKIYDFVLEFHAMYFRTPNDWAVLALLMLACFALGRSRPFRPAWAVLLAWAAWMGFRSLREVWLIAILSEVIIAKISGTTRPKQRIRSSRRTCFLLEPLSARRGSRHCPACLSCRCQRWGADIQGPSGQGRRGISRGRGKLHPSQPSPGSDSERLHLGRFPHLRCSRDSAIHGRPHRRPHSGRNSQCKVSLERRSRLGQTPRTSVRQVGSQQSHLATRLSTSQ